MSLQIISTLSPKKGPVTFTHFFLGKSDPGWKKEKREKQTNGEK